MNKFVLGVAVFVSVSFRAAYGAEESRLTEDQQRIAERMKKRLEAAAANPASSPTNDEKKRVDADLQMLHDAVATSQKMLLYRIDHAVLASEARSFAASTGWGKSGSKHSGYYLKGDDASLPVPIRVLKPTSVCVFEDRIQIEFGGALHHQGISVFRDGIDGAGTKELGKGIWFYSDGNRMFE